MSQNFPKNKSVPGSLSRHQSADEENFEKEFDKIFHSEKEHLPNLKPDATGEIDEERKNYYRSASIDETASLETTSASSTRKVSESEPLQDQGVRHAASDGSLSWNLEGDHSREDFQHNNPILSKRKTSSGSKHRKSSDDKSGKPIKKASTASALQGIPESYILEDEKQDKTEGESTTSFPWKTERHDEPVVYTEDAEEEEEEDDTNKHSGVKFSIGFGGDDEPEEPEDADEDEHHKEKGYRQNRHKKTRKAGPRKMSTDYASLADESGNLQEADLEEIAGHRFEKTKGPSVHQPKRSVMKIGRDELEDIGKDVRMMKSLGYGYDSELDHTPHALFIEMDELDGDQWEERARWIKYEEDLEAERGEWGKPHVSSLTFHSLINLRLCIEGGTLMLDIAVKDLPSLVHRVVEDLSEKDIISEDMKEKVLRVLLFRHKHVHPHENTFRFGLKRSMSQRSMQSLVEEAKKFSRTASEEAKQSPEKVDPQSLNSIENGFGSKDNQQLVGFKGLARSATASSSFRRIDSIDNMMKARKQNIITCMEDGTEGAIVLVGAMDEIDKPIVAFVRLAEAIIMPNTIEVSLPVRFIFILLTPSKNFNMDPHEIGRSFSTLMSNPDFALVAYKVEEKNEILHAINTFLDDSVVLPPGDWDRKHIMPVKEIMEMKQRRKNRKFMQDGVIEVGEVLKKKEDEQEEDGPPKRNPLDRTSVPFGGLIDDIKCRYPKYLSDIKDGLNAQCLAAIIFIYFACLSGAVAFGGLMAAKTGNAIGISETLVISCVAGIIFSLFSGCPLIIIGSTGPVLLFDEALYNFCESTLPDQFLYWRTWVGIWTFVIAVLVAGFQGSFLVKYFTKFMKDIFAMLVSVVFIYEAINKLVKIFKKHPLLATTAYCYNYDTLPECYTDATHTNVTEEGSSMVSLLNHITNVTVHFNTSDEILYCENSEILSKPQPNTALLSAILMFGTFFIGYFLRLFRNSQYLGRNARRALGDFGVPIAIVIMVLLDYGAGDTFTEKLRVPDGLDVTDPDQRGWFIPPTGKPGGEALPIWAMFAAFLPAILIYMLLFIETSICELIMIEKTKDEKGAGIHLDLVILGLINMGCGLFGGPWICAATVRAVAHVSALTVFAPSHIPGESAKAIGVRDQRVTFFVVSVMLGVSVALAPVLKQVPFAVLFGVFLYMGVSGMNGIQFFDRVKLCFMPTKHHPSVTYTKKVKTWRMILFTVLQAVGLALLWAVKSSPAALAFPFFVVAMIPYRWCMKFIFTQVELDALDGPTAGASYDKDEDEEEDFYETANAVPVAQPSQLGLHKAMLGLVNMTQVIQNKPSSTE